MPTPERSEHNQDKPLNQVKELIASAAILVSVIGITAPAGTALSDSFNDGATSAEHLEHSDPLNQYIGHSARGLEKAFKIAAQPLIKQVK